MMLSFFALAFNREQTEHQSQKVPVSARERPEIPGN